MQLEYMIGNAIANDVDELDFFIEIPEQGFTLKDFKETRHYDYAKQFMEEHGLTENKIDLSTFVLVGNNRMEAYDDFVNFELRFDEDFRNNLTFEEFCAELDKGYGNANCVQISRLYENNDGKIWYDNEYYG